MVYINKTYNDLTNSNEYKNFTASVALETFQVNADLDVSYLDDLSISVEHIWNTDISISTEGIIEKVKSMHDKVKSNLSKWINKLILFFFSICDKIIDSVINAKRHFKNIYNKLVKYEEKLEKLKSTSSDNKSVDVKNYVLYINACVLNMLMVSGFFSKKVEELKTGNKRAGDNTFRILSYIAALNKLSLEAIYNIARLFSMPKEIQSAKGLKIEDIFKTFSIEDGKNDNNSNALEFKKIVDIDPTTILTTNITDMTTGMFVSAMNSFYNSKDKLLKAVDKTIEQSDKIISAVDLKDNTRSLKFDEAVDFYKLTIYTTKYNLTLNAKYADNKKLASSILRIRRDIKKLGDISTEFFEKRYDELKKIKDENDPRNYLNLADVVFMNVTQTGNVFASFLRFFSKNLKALENIFKLFEQDLNSL